MVDDERNIRELIRSYLLKEGYDVRTFTDGEKAFEEFLIHLADMLIIDIMMPGMDGYSLCREIRKISDVPIIMVSAKDDEIDRVLGLELGSDDYISKPFSPRELVARVKNIFKRLREDTPRQVEMNNKTVCHDICIYTDERKVMKDEAEIELTAKEYDFLLYLVMNKNRVFNREQLITGIWGYDYVGDTRSVDDLVKRLRKKLDSAGSRLEITTVWGYGYKVSE